MAATDIVITRGGSNAIFEFLALRIPMIIIPLGLHQSRGDQILNAKAFEDRGYSLTLEEEKLNTNTLLEYVETIHKNRGEFQKNMKQSFTGNALQILVHEISNCEVK